MQDDELVNNFITGRDEKSFAQLVDRYARTGISFACKILGDLSTAEDIIQDTFIKFYEGKYRFTLEKGGFKSWFFKVVYNSCVDFLRRNKRFDCLSEDTIFEDESDIICKIAGREKGEMIKTLLNMLPDRQREALILNYYEEHNQINSAAIMGISLKAYESLLSRAKSNLAVFMKGCDL